jgi:hypothetical protein
LGVDGNDVFHIALGFAEEGGQPLLATQPSAQKPQKFSIRNENVCHDNIPDSFVLFVSDSTGKIRRLF